MRELLLMATILLSQLLPNSGFLSQMENILLAKPGPTTTERIDFVPSTIVAAPIKLGTDVLTSNALAAYSVDLISNEVLSSKDSDKRLQVASLTKLMTAYVILKEEQSLDRLFVVPSLSNQTEDSVMGLAFGEKLTVRDLLAGLLINSGSDAAQTLAIGNAGSVDAFVTKMNFVATELSLVDTHFTNPIGWDDPENYSSAKDITELARILIRNENFSEIVSTKTSTVTTTAGRTIPLATTNLLLYDPGYIGVKTGNTDGAGECLVSLYKNGNTEILTTIIGSSNRFGETDSLKGWILEHFSW
jgi:D-alanyl-D-alanine carboxypeptidase (penicillin-binding protein 5/6)